MSEIARRVRAARAYADLTLEELAARIEVSRDTLFRTENQQRRSVKQSELNAIAEACGVPRAWFSVPFEWLDEGQVVSVPISELVDDADARAIRERLEKDGLGNGYVGPRELMKIADALDEFEGRVSWWESQKGKLTLFVVRSRPARPPHIRVPDDATREEVEKIHAAIRAVRGDE